MEKSPLFRNCPNHDTFEYELRADCRNCEKYEHCIDRKVARMSKKGKRVKVRSGGLGNFKRRIVVVAFAAFALMVLGGFASYATDAAPRDDESETAQVVTEVIETEGEVQKVQGIVVETEIDTEADADVEDEVDTEDVEEAETVEEESSEELEESTEETVTDSEEDEDVQTENNVATARISAYGPGTVYYYNLSSEDKILIQKVVYREARGESYEGMVAVAATILNRYVSGNPVFDTDSIYSIVTQSNQFASISGVTQSMLNEYPDIAKAVEDACLGWDPTRTVFPTTGALYFYAPDEVYGYQAEIRTGIAVCKIGGHNFHVDFNI